MIVLVGGPVAEPVDTLGAVNLRSRALLPNRTACWLEVRVQRAHFCLVFTLAIGLRARTVLAACSLLLRACSFTAVPVSIFADWAMAEKKKRRRGPKPERRPRVKQSDVERHEIQGLLATIEAGAPASGTDALQSEGGDGQYGGTHKFEELPLSKHTQRALAEHSFVSMTAIQRATLPHALCGRDILGAAKTGSGKTLCFLIPVRGRVVLRSFTHVCLSVEYAPAQLVAMMPQAAHTTTHASSSQRDGRCHAARGGAIP